MAGISLATSFIFLGDIVDKNNQESLELSEVLMPVYGFAGIFLLSALFAFLRALLFEYLCRLVSDCLVIGREFGSSFA